jgi:WD40-like Beta Propeller Repeat
MRYSEKTALGYIFFTLQFLLLIQIPACKKTNPVESEKLYPERAGYLLTLESGSDVDSIVVVVVQADGRNLMKIPSPDKHSTWPLASPDGQRIAFRPGDDFLSLYVYDRVTGLSTPVLSDRNWDEYAWAPTSRHIVYTGNKTGGGFVIKTVNLESGEISAITDSVPGNERYPHWLADGDALAYVHYDSMNTTRTLYSFDLNSGQMRQLVEGQRDATWSSDGERFFAAGKIYSYPDLTILRDLSSLSPGDELSARWFPNNQDLLIQSGIPDEGLYRVNVVTGASEKIITGAIAFKAISISADGMLIAAIPGGSDNGRFIVADSDGRNQQFLTLPISGANYRQIQFIGDVAW